MLHLFSSEYTITYGVIIPYANSNYSYEELATYCKDKNLDFLPFQLKHRFRDPRVILTYLKVIKAVKSLKPDIIFFANFDQVYINMLLLLIDKDRTIIGVHDVSNHSNISFGRLKSLSKDILLKNFKYFLTYSKLQRGILLRSYPDKTAFTIPLPLINFGKLPEKANKLQVTTFLFFGFIAPYKGLDLLLAAVSRISKVNKDFRLIVAGRTNDWDEVYKPLIDDESVVQTEIRYVNNDEIPTFFANADYVVLPYRDTTQSGPLMIAYNYNVPVIASDAEGFKEFFEPGITGYTFELGNPLNLDEVLLAAIERTPEDYANLKKRLEKYKNQHFSNDQLIDRYERMFDQVSSSFTK